MNLECLRVLNNPEDTMKHKLTQYIYHPHCRAWHVTPDLCMPGGAYIYIHRYKSPFLPGVACNTRLCMPGGAYI